MRLLRRVAQLPANTTVNWHLTESCNYRCNFCFAHFRDSKTVQMREGLRILEEIARAGATCVNFAGGEPLLNPHLDDYVHHTVSSLGMKATIITNGSKITKKWTCNTAPMLSQVGLSIDSVNEGTNRAIGRGYGNHVAIVNRAIHRLRENAPDTKIKINTVVTSQTKSDDWTDFFEAHPSIYRWKVFKVLRSVGENDRGFDDVSVTEEEFAAFIKRHCKIPAMVAEDNEAMTGSYVMIDPKGRAYTNWKGRHTFGPLVQSVGLLESLQAAGGFSYERFLRRGGSHL